MKLRRNVSIDRAGGSSKLTVDNNGTMVACGLGKVKVTANMDNGNTVFNITVIAQKATSININDEQTVFIQDALHQFTATVFPENASEKGVLWKSSNPKIVIIDAKGNMLIKSTGKVTITATAKGSSKVKDTMDIYIGIPSESLSIKGSETATSGSKVTFEALILPSNTTNKGVKWEIEPKSAGKISSKGVLTLKSTKVATSVIVRATTDDTGLVAEHALQVLPETK